MKPILQHSLFPARREEGLRNLIFFCPSGQRLEWMQDETETRLRLIYLPHGERRPDLESRTFSTRDIHTPAFADIRIAQLPNAAVTGIDYDPFLTRFAIGHASGAKNEIRLLTFAAENAFALSGKTAVTILFKPHRAFEIEDGWLRETFEDRGESITSFVFFDGIRPNRLRILEDGSVALQIVGREALVFGAEENAGQVRRLHRRFARRAMDDLVAENEPIIDGWLAAGRPTLNDPAIQAVCDLNRRILVSGVDLGGACFSGFNREYYLTWHRDGGLTSGAFADAGNPELIRRWAPLSVANPTRKEMPDGSTRTLYSQLVGTRWCKDEEDGLYFAVYSAFSHWRCTGKADFLSAPMLGRLCDGLEMLLAETFTPPSATAQAPGDTSEAGLFSCSARCEMMTCRDPAFGSEPVNGRYPDQPGDGITIDGKKVARLWSLYINMLNWQAIRMLVALLRLAPEGPLTVRAVRYEALADELARTILTRFRAPDGGFLGDLAEFADGARRWIGIAQSDEWEMNWSLVMPPFLFHPDASAPAVRRMIDHFTGRKIWCHSPWVLQSSLLREFGDHGLARQMLEHIVRDANTPEHNYPFHGAISERAGATVTKSWPNWRPLMFVIGPFLRALAADLLAPLPFGVAARAGLLTTAIREVHFKGSRINVESTGEGTEVASFSLNGQEVTTSLQLPELLLRSGERNELVIRRGAPTSRLYRSDAILREFRARPDGSHELHLDFPLGGSVVWQGPTDSIRDAATGAVPTFTAIPESPALAIAHFPSGPRVLHAAS
jgi:hypothetical protein